MPSSFLNELIAETLLDFHNKPSNGRMMGTRTIETIVEIGEDRRLIVQLPHEIPVGQHRVIATLDPSEPGSTEASRPWTFPVLNTAQWPADMPMNREELYGDSGR